MSTKEAAVDTEILIPYRDTGIKPMTPQELAQYQGVEEGEYPREYYLRNRAKDGACYYEELGRRSWVLFPTSDSIENLFKDTSTRDFEMLERHLRENDIREELMEPFRVLMYNSIRESKHTYNRRKSIKEAVKKHDFISLDHSKPDLIIVKPRHAELFVSPYSDEDNVEKFAESIREHFFNEFLPGIEEHC